jgi:DNA-binding PucR family transcriptional regulator
MSVATWDEVLMQTAAELRPQVDDVARECAAYVHRSQPELAADDDLAAGLYESARDNLRLVFEMLAEGRPVSLAAAPPGAIAYAAIFVRRGQPLAALLRAYRLGTMWCWHLWRRELGRRISDPELMMEAVDHAMAFVFDYVDHVAEEVTEQYAMQRERWARSAEALRRETVQRVLDGGESIDVGTASTRLKYELRRCHVGLILYEQHDGEGEDAMVHLEQAALAIAAQLGSARPLLIPEGRHELWAWMGFDAPPELELLDHQVVLDAGAARRVHLAVGEPGEGAAGFAATHHEACIARELASRTHRPAGQAVRYGRMVVPSLLLVDAERARSFVLRELGELARGDDATTRLRATLLVFLDEGSRPLSTAKRLGIHQNTVNYRIRQAEALLGHAVRERRYELETALRLLPLVL